MKIAFLCSFLLLFSFSVFGQGSSPNRLTTEGEVYATAFSNFTEAEKVAQNQGKSLVITDNQIFTANKTISVPLVFKSGGKLSINSGITVNINNSLKAPPERIFDGAGRVNFQNAKTRRLLVEWWGATGQDSTDDAAAVNAAVDSLGATAHQSGAVIAFGNYGYVFSNQLDFTLSNNITFEGGESQYAGGSPTIAYNGRVSPAIKLDSTRGITFKNMRFQASSAFSGVLIQGGASVSAGDTLHLKIESCSFAAANPAATLLTLDRTIVSQVRDSNFIGGAVAIVGAITTHDSNVILVESNHFKGQAQASIKSPGQWWTIINNTFSGGAPDAYAVTTDDAQRFTSRALLFENNYFETNKGYAELPPKGHLIKVKVAGAAFVGNSFSESGKTGNVIELVTSRGVAFVGNRFEGGASLTGVSGTHNAYGISFTGNDFIGTTPVGGAVAAVYSASGNEGLADRMNGLIVLNEAASAGANGLPGITFGYKTTLGGANSLAQIGVLDSTGTGYLNRSLGYFAPSSNNNPHIFFTWNGSKFVDRLTIGLNSVTSNVPISVPTDSFNVGTWNNSTQVPTKGAIEDKFASLTASDIKGGTFAASQIPNLDAGKINSGTITNSISTNSLTVGSGASITRVLSATALVDFGATPSGACEDSVPITVNGAQDGDVVQIGVPASLASIPGTSFSAYVSAASRVKIRRCNSAGSTASNPNAATIRVAVMRF
ncbi:MAG: hypothetical protein M3209_05980 [Acidobacteriota bacterium]|nr:hypothetical protein [Acidobacteriota bacterium]